MSIEKSFGIGCYHFGVNKITPFLFTGNDYLNNLEDTLSKIANLNKLEIDADEDFKNFSQSMNNKLPNLEDDEYFFPNPLILDIQFELYIPYRIQSKLIEIDEKYLDTYSENFKVNIIYNFYLPVAIIEIINPKKQPDPSSGVVLVREFIRSELDKNKSEYIRFECLGPSPFHIDCFLKSQTPSPNEEWLFNPEEHLIRGYDQLIINYNVSEFKDGDEALEYLKRQISNEFGFCYYCIQIRNQKMHSWDEIQNNLERLTQIQNSKGIKGIFKKMFQRQTLIEILFTDLTTFEGKDLFDSGSMQNSYNRVFIAKDEVSFKIFIDQELEEKYNYPVKQTTDLITFIERRRVKSMEFIIALIAAIIGGTIGALLTIYFKGGQ